MKILHVINTLRTGGAESLVAQIVPRLNADGFPAEVAVFVGEDTHFLRQLQQHGVNVHIFATSGSVYNPKHIFRLRKLMRGFDIIHTHNTSPQLFAAIASIGLKQTLITTEHGGSNRRRSRRFYRFLDKRMYNRYRYIICISDNAEKSLREYLNSSSDRIIKIYNGIDTARYANAQAAELSLENIPANVKFITMVAGFRWEKDQDTLIKGMARLPENFHLLLVGDGVRRAECESLVRNLNLKSRIHFLGLRTDVPEILKASDYIVMSSHFEGLSLSSLEGMAAGKPFIASDVDGLRDITQGAGILFPHGDAQSFADAIINLDQSPALLDATVAKCKSRAAAYDISVMVKHYEDIYSSL